MGDNPEGKPERAGERGRPLTASKNEQFIVQNFINPESAGISFCSDYGGGSFICKIPLFLCSAGGIGTEKGNSGTFAPLCPKTNEIPH